MNQSEIIALSNDTADRYGIPRELLLACAIAESNLDPLARRPKDPAKDAEYWPDVSFGLCQQTVRWSMEYLEGGGGRDYPGQEVVERIGALYFNPEYALEAAAETLANLRKIFNLTDNLENLCRYNSPAGRCPPENRANYERALVWAQLLLEEHEEEMEMALPAHVYTLPGGESVFVNVRDSTGEDKGDSPRGTMWRVVGEGTVPGIGPAWAVEAFIAKSVTSLDPLEVPAITLPIMAWPVLNQDRVITSLFDSPRDYANKKHEGIDFRAYSGREIVPFYDGKVIEIRQGGYSPNGYGKYVVIEHDLGGKIYRSKYAHLDAVRVKVGDTVLKGATVLGPAGKTGTALAHLHTHFISDELARGDTRGYFEPGVIDFIGFLPQPYTVL